MVKERYKLWVLFLFIALVIVVRIMAESTSYVSPDSTYYLSAADHVMKGEGLIAPDPTAPEKNVYFAVWPAGYPLCIAGVGLLTGTSALVASKIVNLIFLGLTFGLLFFWFGEKSWFVALYFCSFGMLEIYSYSWSEAPFLFFVLLLCYFVFKDLERDSGPRLFFQVFFCLVALFFFRYAGLIYFPAIGLLLVYSIYKKQKLKSGYYFSALFFASVGVFYYLFLNKEMSGHYTGIGDRVQLEQESWPQFMLLLIRGLWNQLTLARQCFFSGEMDYLYVALLMVQAGVVAVLFYFKKRWSAPFLKSRDTKVLLSFGLFYLMAIVVLRKIQPFDPFDYRILAPFSLPLFVAFFGRLIKPDVQDYFEKVKPWVVGFMLLSLLVNLPKEYLVEWVRGLF
ncbi:MAG: hypothetical protein JWM14_805 [Chitinophagaceae bacterium]|nr:hypothetical protein [Chitinophagaceae bacterium]